MTRRGERVGERVCGEERRESESGREKEKE